VKMVNYSEKNWDGRTRIWSTSDDSILAENPTKDKNVSCLLINGPWGDTFGRSYMLFFARYSSSSEQGGLL